MCAAGRRTSGFADAQEYGAESSAGGTPTLPGRKQKAAHSAPHYPLSTRVAFTPRGASGRGRLSLVVVVPATGYDAEGPVFGLHIDNAVFLIDMPGPKAL